MTGWRVGQRVARKNGDEFGTVTEIGRDGTLKVKWDGGRTSYYDPYTPANVKLASSEEVRPPQNVKSKEAPPSKRRPLSETISLDQRLGEEAKRLRKETEGTTPGD
jgi:hypothetical protein